MLSRAVRAWAGTVQPEWKVTVAGAVSNTGTPLGLDLSDDEDLVQACLAGSQDAFDVLVQRHRRAIYRLCYGFVGNHEDASDLSQTYFSVCTGDSGASRVSHHCRPGSTASVSTSASAGWAPRCHRPKRYRTTGILTLAAMILPSACSGSSAPPRFALRSCGFQSGSVRRSFCACIMSCRIKRSRRSSATPSGR